MFTTEEGLNRWDEVQEMEEMMEAEPYQNREDYAEGTRNQRGAFMATNHERRCDATIEVLLDSLRRLYEHKFNVASTYALQEIAIDVKALLAAWPKPELQKNCSNCGATIFRSAVNGFYFHDYNQAIANDLCTAVKMTPQEEATCNCAVSVEVLEGWKDEARTAKRQRDEAREAVKKLRQILSAFGIEMGELATKALMAGDE